MKSRPQYSKMIGNYFIIFFLHVIPSMLSSQSTTPAPFPKGDTLQIDVWSDVVCPYCYIGKKNLDQALKQWKPEANVHIRVKSFLLDPDLKTDTTKPFEAYLAGVKGIEINDVKMLNQRVTQMAKLAGLEFRMDKVMIANSIRAHQLLKFANTFGKQDEVLEKLFAANFTEGRNIDDVQILEDIAVSAGLSGTDVQNAILSGKYLTEINSEQETAQRLGIRSVPYFIFNKQFAMSGAQDTTVFLEFLKEKFK